jgi:hypothetical protein
MKILQWYTLLKLSIAAVRMIKCQVEGGEGVKEKGVSSACEWDRYENKRSFRRMIYENQLWLNGKTIH